MAWIEVARSQLEKCKWRSWTSLTISFIVLVFFFIYDRSYLDSALIIMDEKFSPLPRINKNDFGSFLPSTFLPLISSVPLGCNIFEGKWVFDNSYPLYESCIFVEQDFQCNANGRKDRRYQKLRWQPHDCDIPRFNAKDMLMRLKGKRVVIVGDSMGRTQWESLSCLLLQGVANKSSVHMIGKPITKVKWHIGTRFNDHNVTLDYYRSPWLVDAGPNMPKDIQSRIRFTLKLKKIDSKVAQEFLDADVLLINSGHWWVRQKIFNDGGRFQIDKRLKLGMTVKDAYEMAMTTVASFVNNNINFQRTEVFFRSFETSHWEVPMASMSYGNISGRQLDPRKNILQHVVGQMGQPVTFLDVTEITAYRPDGHVFNWTGNKNVLDCAHWCLPGVPDTWNELLYGSLLQRGRGVWGPGFNNAASSALLEETILV